MKKETLRRADMITSIFLMIFAIFVFIESVKIFFNPFGRKDYTVSEEEKVALIKEWYLSPAIIPLIISVLIFICGAVYLVQAKKDGGKLDFFKRDKFKSFFISRETKITVLIIGWLAIYIFMLIPLCRRFLNFFPRFYGFPFLIATFIYLVVFMICTGEKNKKAISMSILISCLGSLAITYGFGVLAQIPLP